jgi:hypothetical protein
MLKNLILTTLLLSANLIAQNSVSDKANCSCLMDFDQMVEKVVINYAGYDIKTNGNNKSRLEKLTKRLRHKASKAIEKNCETILSEWTDFFKDGHLRVRSKSWFESYNKEFAKRQTKPTIEISDSNFIVLHIPSFQVSKPELDKILSDNKEKISTTPNLIIDLHGNDGGSDWTYTNLMPILYTNPIITVAGGTRSSDDSIKYYERFVDKKNPENTLPWVTDLLKMLRENKGKIVSNDKDDQLILEEVQEYPKNIAILIDETNASAAETFLLKARQSKKVKLFGSNTKGVVDYLNPMFETLPCNKFILAVPLVRRSMKLPKDAIDNVGISPDVRIDKNVKNKIRFVIDFYKNSKTH